MFGYFTPVLILQIFCLYHAFKHRSQYWWFFLIIFLPIVGCIVYLYFHFFRKINVDTITKEVKQAVNPNHRIEELEKASKITNTFSNKIKLAEEYINKGRYAEALDMYLSCQNGIYEDDPELLRGLVKAYYLNQDYKNAIKSGEQLKGNLEFKESTEKVAFAWSYSHNNQKGKAEAVFKELDMSYSNYPHRLEYTKFLIEENRTEDAKEKLEEMLEEITHMDGYEKKQKRGIRSEIQKVYQSIN